MLADLGALSCRFAHGRSDQRLYGAGARPAPVPPVHGRRAAQWDRARPRPADRSAEGTIDTARNFGVDRDLACMVPGRCADVVLEEDLDDFSAGTVIARDEVVGGGGGSSTCHPGNTKTLSPLGPGAADAAGRHGLRVNAGSRAGMMTANVIAAIDNHAAPRHRPRTWRCATGAARSRAGPARASRARHHYQGGLPPDRDYVSIGKVVVAFIGRPGWACDSRRRAR